MAKLRIGGDGTNAPNDIALGQLGHREALIVGRLHGAWVGGDPIPVVPIYNNPTVDMMPYYFEPNYGRVSEPSSDEDWSKVEQIWDVIHSDLTGVQFETAKEALEQKYRKSLDTSDPRLDSINVARYRETDDRESLLEFHQWGLEALNYTENCIKKRQFGACFAYHWAKLAACHGFVCAAMMARGDDLQSRRAGKASEQVTHRRAQVTWYLHWRRHHQEELGWTVIRLNSEFLRICWEIAQGLREPPDGFEKDWFEKALGEETTENIKTGKPYKKPARKLSNSIKRSGYGTPRAENFFTPKLEDTLKIPPIEASFYS